MPRGAMMMVIWFFVLILFPITLLLITDRVQLHPAMPLFAAITIYASAQMAVIAARRQPQPIALTFWIFVYVFLALAPMLQVAIGTYPWAIVHEDEDVMMASLIVLVGVIAFGIGYTFCSPVRVSDRVLTPLEWPLHPPRVAWASGAVLGLTPFLVQSLGGWERLFYPRAVASPILAALPSSLQLVAESLQSLPSYVLMLAVAVLVLQWRRERRYINYGWWLLLLGLTTYTIVLNNPISTARLRVGMILVSVVILLVRRRNVNLVVGVGLPLVLVLVFPFADLFRSTLDVNIADRVGDTSVQRELTLNGDYDAFQSIANTHRVVREGSFTYGRQLLGTALFWVPKGIWLGKPAHSGEYVAGRVGYAYTNLSAPLWAELFLDGGWPLLILGFMFYGSLCRIFDGSLASTPKKACLASTLIPLYAGYQIFLLRGALMSGIAYIAPVMLILLMLVQVRSRLLK